MRLLVLGAGPGSLGVLAAARRRGLTLVAADRDPSAPGFRYADRRAIVSIEDEPAIDRLARAEEVDGLVAPGTDHAVGIAARIAHRLGLPHPLQPEAAALAVSRLRQRERLAAAGFAQPRSVVCRTFAEAAAAAAELGFPVVVETPDSRGERAVRLARTPAELGAATAGALAESRGDYCLVEELPGLRSVTVNGFVLAGTFVPLTITDPCRRRRRRSASRSRTCGRPSCRGAGAAVCDTTAAAAAELGIDDGPVTAQLLLSPRRAALAKVSARVGGGHDAELCRLALGVDESALAVSAALGEPVHEHDLAPVAVAGGACVRFLVAPPGELRDVAGVERAFTVAGVRAIHSTGGPATSSASSCAHPIARAPCSRRGRRAQPQPRPPRRRRSASSCVTGPVEAVA